MTNGLTDKQEMARDAAIADPKSSTGIFTLPGGYLESTPQGPVLHREVQVIEIDGNVEDMLASETTPPYLKYGQLIAMCTPRVGPFTDEGLIAGTIMPSLSIADRAFLILAARRVSLGDAHHFVQPCDNKNCLDPATLNDREPKRSRSLYTVSLADIEVRPMPDPMARSYTVEVPAGGRKVQATFHVMTGADEARIARYTGDKSSMSIMARLDVWDGKAVALRPDGRNAPEVLRLVKSFGISTRNALRDHFAAVEGGIDTSLQITCPLCKMEFETELALDADFFRPSAVLAAWKRKSST